MSADNKSYIDKNLHLYGCNDSHIDLEWGIDRRVLKPLQRLQQKASAKGFELKVVSGYRDFDRQLAIWNAKVSGNRPVYDNKGDIVDVSKISEWELIEAILRWSALPGASRHHWGTDIDVYDLAAVDQDYQVELSVEEVVDSGPFGPMHIWLDDCIEQNGAEGFYRPYQFDHGGIAPERWHLSYAPLAHNFQRDYDLAMLRKILEEKPLALKEVVLSRLDEIFERYFLVS